MAGLELPIESHVLQAMVSEPVKPVLDVAVISPVMGVYLSQSDKGELIDETFQLLLVMSVPVFTFVVAILVYSAIAFRHRGDPDEDGKPLTGRGPVPLAWFALFAAGEEAAADRRGRSPTAANRRPGSAARASGSAARRPGRWRCPSP